MGPLEQVLAGAGRGLHLVVTKTVDGGLSVVVLALAVVGSPVGSMVAS